MTLWLLSVALLLLQLSEHPAAANYPIKITVSNLEDSSAMKTYEITIFEKKTVLDVLMELQASDNNFKFTYTGNHIESVNGVNERQNPRVLWMVEVGKAGSNFITSADGLQEELGENNKILLKFTRAEKNVQPST